MVALQMAIQSKGEIVSLILSAGQVKPPRAIMLLQFLLFSLMPEKWILSQMPDSLLTDDRVIQAAAREDALLTRKSGFLNALKSASEVNFSEQLSTVQMPTLVMCGGNDKPNLKAARDLASGIPAAELKIIPDVGHVWNIENPDLFNQYIIQFMTSQM